MAAIVEPVAVAEEEILPTLFLSRCRPQIADDDFCAKPQLQRRGRRPAPASLDIPEDCVVEPVAAAAAAAGGPELGVKNTFIYGTVPPSPSTEAFLGVRAAQTCPSRHAGRVAEMLEGFAAGRLELAAAGQPTETFADAAPSPMAQPSTPWAVETPLSMSMPVLSDVAAWYGMQPDTSPQWPAQECGGERKVLSLESALGHEAPSSQEAYHVMPPSVAWAPAGGMYDYMGSQQQLVHLPPQAVTLSTTPPMQAPHVQVHAAESAWLAPPVRAGSVPGGAPEYAPTVKGAEEVPGIPPPPSAPAPGSLELPSLGSAEHAMGTCKPCAFLYTKGCNNAATCKFCHLCGPEERKRRQKDKILLAKEQRKQLKESAVA